MRNQRQSLQPNQFPRTRRPITHRLPTSFDPGLEVLVGVVPVFREETVSGQASFAVQMAEMPKPLLNSVSMRVRAWFVPYTAMERFPTLESFYAAWAGEPEREGMDLVPVFNTGSVDRGEIMDTSGLMFNEGANDGDVINLDFIEAYNLVINHERRNINAVLAEETERDIDNTDTARATFVNHLFADVKPTFDAASVEGLVPAQLGELKLPVSGLGVPSNYGGFQTSGDIRVSSGETITASESDRWGNPDGSATNPRIRENPDNPGFPAVFAELQNAVSQISLAEIDRGRVIAQLARIRDRFAGHPEVRHIDTLMAGWHIPFEAMREPMLLNEQVTTFNTAERHAMDGPSLDQSVTVGVASVSMSVTLPATSTGGYILVTATCQPDQIFERRQDPMLYTVDVDQMPDALRDTLDIHKVDVVTCGEVDLTHDTPDATYGYSPRHMRFARPVDRVGGKFRDVAGNEENRASLWLYNVENPVYGQSHHLCPKPFPKDVFADTLADAFEARFVLAAQGTGITQFGPQVLEDQGSYAAMIEYINEDGEE